MSDIIQLLPDAVANQIAAGEVVQRPASAVKELVENAVDAGADEISILLKDAGRTLIQVIDNGRGMTETDARLSFERHATSKIRNANDLFEIRTKGFRGEALASIAAIAQVVMRTQQPGEEIGTEICISGSEVESQQPGSFPQGTNISVKNLFYNVPARRKFLKSNTTELKHIINEFQRIVLCHPEVAFSLRHNDSDIYQLPASNLRQRIVHVFGKTINTNLNNLNSDATMVKLTGFIGKPENSRKTTGEQFFFVNRRYMRHPYFHRAVMRAYENLLPPDTYPSYFIYFDIDPNAIDVNIHPTKTEIKFEDEQALYRIVQAAVREALGKSSAMPSIDFDTEGVIDIPVTRSDTEFTPPEIQINPNFNPFDNEKPSGGSGGGGSYSGSYHKTTPAEGWESLFTEAGNPDMITPNQSSFEFEGGEQQAEAQSVIAKSQYIQLKNRFILTPVKSGLMLVDQKLAYERILYEQFIYSVAHNHGIAQRELYPTKIDLDPAHYLLINEIKDELALLGIDLGDLGGNTIVVNSCPAGIESTDLQGMVEALLEEYKETGQKPGASVTKAVAASLAKAASAGYVKQMQQNEMQQLVDELFACENPNYATNGKKIMSIIQLDELEKYLT